MGMGECDHIIAFVEFASGEGGWLESDKDRPVTGGLNYEVEMFKFCPRCGEKLPEVEA